VRTRPFRSRLALLVPLLVVASACGDSDDRGAPARDTPRPVVVDDELGVVRIAPGEQLELRLLIDPTDPELSAVIVRAAEVALEHFGGVRGFRATLGTPIEVVCDRAGGAAAVAILLEDPAIIGAIGPICRDGLLGMAAEADAAGLVLVTPTITEPELTQSPLGVAGPQASGAVFRMIPNGLVEAQVAAAFAFEELGLRRAGTVSDGSTRTEALTDTFRAAFEGLGGTVVVTGRLTPTDDATSTYAQLAEAGPDIVFAPLPPRRLLTLWDGGTDSANRLRTTRLTTASSIDAEFLADDRAQDHYIAQVQVDLTEGASAVTGMSAAIALERIAVPLGRDEADIASIWRNTYDAVTLLLSALTDASLIDASDRSLVIGRKDLRATLRTTGFEGMSGTVRCDEFGDCAGAKGQIRLHSDPTLRSLDDLEIVFDWSE